MLPFPRRLTLPLLAAAALALLAALAHPAPGAAATSAAKACRTAAPAKVTFTRDRGRAYGWLRWTKPKRAHGASALPRDRRRPRPAHDDARGGSRSA